MKFLENCLPAFLSYQNLGDCSLCEMPIEIELPQKKEKEAESKKFSTKKSLKAEMEKRRQ